MSNNPPPDDFSKTTPNIDLPDDAGSSGDWNKTNYNYPRQPAPDEWGKTVTNIRPIETGNDDFGKTYHPGAKAPSTPEWGVTEARSNVGSANFGTSPGDFGGTEGYGKTTPYFRLPEAEKAKYENLPPTPTEQAEKEEQEKKGGIPGWFWVLAGLLVMFFFALIVLAIVYFLIIKKTDFKVQLNGAPPGSRIVIDGKTGWGTTNPDGTFDLPVLDVGSSHKVEIINPQFSCDPLTVRPDGPKQVTAICRQVAVKPEVPLGPPAGCDPKSIKPGEFDKAAKCYDDALSALPHPFTAEQLVTALNILIINFASNKYDIPDARKQNLIRAAQFIKELQTQDPNIVLEVGGHTDNVGKPEKNQPLSENRANAVKKFLTDNGVNPNGLQTKGYAATEPLQDIDMSTEQGKFLNRRIGYKIVKK